MVIYPITEDSSGVSLCVANVAELNINGSDIWRIKSI